MRIRPASYLALLLALFIINTGFAQASLLLCQNKCEQTQLKEIEIPECCRGMKDTDDSFAQTGNHAMSPSDCPHVDSNNKVSDAPALIASSTKVPAPTKSPAFAGTVPALLVQLSDVPSRTYRTRSGLSPLNVLAPPPYRLYCSLLI